MTMPRLSMSILSIGLNMLCFTAGSMHGHVPLFVGVIGFGLVSTAFSLRFWKYRTATKPRFIRHSAVAPKN